MALALLSYSPVRLTLPLKPPLHHRSFPHPPPSPSPLPHSAHQPPPHLPPLFSLLLFAAALLSSTAALPPPSTSSSSHHTNQHQPRPPATAAPPRPHRTKGTLSSNNISTNYFDSNWGVIYRTLLFHHEDHPFSTVCGNP